MCHEYIANTINKFRTNAASRAVFTHSLAKGQVTQYFREENFLIFMIISRFPSLIYYWST